MSFKKDKNRSLIMCVTPLQMIIAEKIIQLNSEQDFDLLVIALSDNKKYRYYYDRLRSVCVNSLYYISQNNSLDFINYIVELNKKKLNYSYKSYYLANIYFRHFQYILSKSNRPEVFTFDDGVANLLPDSRLYASDKPKGIKGVVWRIMGIKHYTEDIRRFSHLHYTIYKDVGNIVKNRQFISLSDNENDDSEKITNNVIFYLGQPLTDINIKYDSNFIEENLRKLNVDYYFPHPREALYPNGNFEIIESRLVFEDFIIKYLQKNKNTNVTVYSFTSTALINIMSLSRVKVKFIFDEEFFAHNQKFYSLAQDVLGIETVNLE